MENSSHLRAFSLLLVSSERPLSKDERGFLDQHLRTCLECRAQARTHTRLLREIRKPVADNLPSSRPPVSTSEMAHSFHEAVKIKKLNRIASAAAAGGLVIILLAALLMILGRSPIVPSPAGIFGREAQATAGTTPGTSTPRVDVITYTVLEGDTILEIANHFGLKPETILWSNYDTLMGEPSHALRPGMVINILPVDGVYYEWKQGDNLFEVASRLGVGPQAIVEWPGNHLNRQSLGDLSRPNIAPGTMLVVPGGQLEFAPPGTRP